LSPAAHGDVIMASAGTSPQLAGPAGSKVTRTDLTLYQLLQERHVLVAPDSVPQGFEGGIDDLAAAVSSAHTFSYPCA
jgi:hypothetical protein